MIGFYRPLFSQCTLQVEQRSRRSDQGEKVEKYLSNKIKYVHRILLILYTIEFYLHTAYLNAVSISNFLEIGPRNEFRACRMKFDTNR